MTDLLNKVITLSERTDKTAQFGTMAKLKDEKGLTYTVFKTKKDGSDSVAWTQLQELNLGDTVQVGYSEEEKNHPEHGAYTARTVRSFNKDIGEGAMNHSQQTNTPLTSPNTASQSPSDEFWKIKTYAQCLWGYWIKVKNGEGRLTHEEQELVWDEMVYLNQMAEKRVTRPESMNVAEEKIKQNDIPLPEEPLDVSDVPF